VDREIGELGVRGGGRGKGREREGEEREGEEREMEAEGKALYMSPTFYGQKRFLL